MEKKYFIGLILIISLIIIWNLNSKNTELVYNLNESYCNNIETPDMKITCMAMFKKDFNICKENFYFNDYCVDKVFQVTKNFSESLCESFSNYYPKMKCYVWLAKEKRDISFCKKAGIREFGCYWKMAILLKNPEICNYMGVDCEKYQCLAEVTGNASYCKKVPDSGEKENCIMRCLKQENACKINLPEYGEILYYPECMYDLAKRTNDISICWKIDGEIKWKCLADMGATEEVCDQADTQVWKDFCLVEILKNKLINKN